jgi:hypothetical protein
MLSLFERRTFLLLGGIILPLVPATSAQTTHEGPRIPDGGTREVLVSIFIPSIPGAAFTATVNTESVRALADGTRITLKNHRLIARDKSGRIFQERRLLVPEDGKQESVVTQTEITDPVRTSNTSACHKSVFANWKGFNRRKPSLRWAARHRRRPARPGRNLWERNRLQESKPKAPES